MRGMKVLIGLLASSTAIVSVPALAAPVFYQGQISDDGSSGLNPAFVATYLFKTDGTIGELTYANLLSYDFFITFENSSFTISNANSSVYVFTAVTTATDFNIKDDLNASIIINTLDYNAGVVFTHKVSVVGFGDGETGKEAYVTSPRPFAVAVTTPVPEPATWAMMLLGFGMMGRALRYGRKRASVAYA